MTTAPEQKLADVAEIRNGKTPPTGDQRSAGHPVLKVKDVSEIGEFRGGFGSFVDEDFALRFRERCLREGDTLILNAAHNANYVGSKTFRAGSDVAGALATGEWLIIRPIHERLDASYLYHWVNTPRTRAAVRELVKGIHLYPKDVARLHIPLPALDEQRRIANILDRTHALRVSRRDAIERVRSLKQSVFLEMFGDPHQNPQGWPVTTLGSIATFVGGGTPRRDNPSFFKGEICWATSKDMKGEFLENTQEHITELAIEKSATNLVPPGTLLIVVKSKVLMHSLPLLITQVPTCFGQDIKGIRLNDGWSTQYVAASIRALKNVLLSKARGVNTEGLTLEHLRSLPVLEVPGSMQEAYESHCAETDRLKRNLDVSSDVMEDLFGSVSGRAFAGML